MMLFRYLAGAALVSALLAGCSQSLFGDVDGDGDGNGRADGGPGPGQPDAAPGTPDGGPPVTGPEDGGNGRDTGVVPPDAEPRDLCPSPCVGDAFDDFSNMQGGMNGLWRYVEVRSEPASAPYFDMSGTLLPGPALGWLGTGDQEPTIALCAASPDELPCFELKGRVALTSKSNALDAHEPALMWSAPAAGTYELSGDWVVSSMAPETAVELRIVKNVFEETLVADTATRPLAPLRFSSSIDLMQGDRLVLIFQTLTEDNVTAGVNFFITGPRSP